jgi:hypothetical protein
MARALTTVRQNLRFRSRAANARRPNVTDSPLPPCSRTTLVTRPEQPQICVVKLPLRAPRTRARRRSSQFARGQGMRGGVNNLWESCS